MIITVMIWVWAKPCWKKLKPVPLRQVNCQSRGTLVVLRSNLSIPRDPTRHFGAHRILHELSQLILKRLARLAACMNTCENIWKHIWKHISWRFYYIQVLLSGHLHGCLHGNWTCFPHRMPCLRFSCVRQGILPPFGILYRCESLTFAQGSTLCLFAKMGMYVTDPHLQLVTPEATDEAGNNYMPGFAESIDKLNHCNLPRASAFQPTVVVAILWWRGRQALWVQLRTKLQLLDGEMQRWAKVASRLLQP